MTDGRKPALTCTRREALFHGLSLAGFLCLNGFSRFFRNANTSVSRAGSLASRSVHPSSGSSPSFRDLTVSPSGQCHAAGERLSLRGTVRNEAGIPVRQARVVLLQGAANGSHRHPGFVSVQKADPGFLYHGVCLTGESGQFEFLTVLPGTPSPGQDSECHPEAILTCSKAGFRGRVLRMSRQALLSGLDSPIVADLVLGGT